MINKQVGVIGMGRVGLPLALILNSRGVKIQGFEIDGIKAGLINKKVMPFAEEGCNELLKKSDLNVATDYRKIPCLESIIITVGTPLANHIETDLSQIKALLNSIYRYLHKDQNIMLRSTVTPGTTSFVKKYLEKHTGLQIGRQLFLSYCPERIIEGKALEELIALPQIIGSEDKASASKAEGLFSVLGGEILHTDYISAELTKLFNNISRYTRFGLANYFALISERFNVNIHEIIHLANYHYPRDKIAFPGLTAGSCLRKDFGMINEHLPYPDILISAWKINEYMPLFLVDNLKKRTPITGKKIAVLGYNFKKDSDDPRDSLVPKLIRYLEREVPDTIMIYEPYQNCINGNVSAAALDEKYFHYSLERALPEADLVFLAVNHTIFKDNFPEIIKACRNDTWFVDIWNISKTDRIFYQKGEIPYAE